MKKANARARGLRASLASTRAHRAGTADRLGGRQTPRHAARHGSDAIGVSLTKPACSCRLETAAINSALPWHALPEHAD
jgi:hypothetical protein